MASSASEAAATSVHSGVGLDTPRSTIRLGWHGWDPSLAQATAPLGEPMRPQPQPPAQSPVLWTAPPIPWRRKHCYLSWGPNPSNADDVPFLGAMISWWSLRKPMHSANMMPDTAPRRELNRSVLSPRRLYPHVLPVPQTQTLHWISTQWISFIRQISGPDTGSLHRPLDIHQATVCATSVAFGDAPLRLLPRKPVRAVPGPKSGPRFFMPSWCDPCQARGVRVVGYLASGPTGAAILVLRQQVLITAKLRGRHSIFLFGVIAASPCCTWYTGRSTEVRPIHRPSAPQELYLLSPEASLLSSCQLTFVLSRWPWPTTSSAPASVSSCSCTQWPLCAPVKATLLLLHSAARSVPTHGLDARQEFVHSGPCLSRPSRGAVCRLQASAHMGCKLHPSRGHLEAFGSPARLCTNGLTAWALRYS